MKIERIVEYKGEQKSYDPSRTELLLEDICISFDTELLNAYIDWSGGWPLLCRLSKPITFQNQKDDKKRSIHFQYTKFFPFRYIDEIVEDYNIRRESNKKKRLDQTKIGKIIHKKIEEKCNGNYESNYMLLLFKTDLVDEFRVRRYPKQVYVAIYEGDFKDYIKPFNVHEVVIYPNGRALPESHLTYTRNQTFYSVGVPKQDGILINYPRFPREDAHLREALSVHRVDIKKHDPPNPIRHLVLDSSNQNETVMGLIQAYVKNICLGRTL